MKVIAIAAVALLATVAMPAASAYPCDPTEPDCEVIEFRDCPPGTYGPHIYVLGDELTMCWH